LFFSLITRILLSFFGTLQLDQGTFIAWSSELVRNGFKNFYSIWSDYLPGYLYFLWGLGKINLLSLIPQVLLYKIPAILADILTGYLIFKILRGYKNEKWGIVGSLIYLFNPAVIVNSALWGQVDSLTSLASVAALYFLDSNYLISASVLSLGTLIKPQAAFIFPIIFLLMIRKKWNMLKISKYVLVGLSIFILGFVPFSQGNLFQFIVGRLQLSANQYPYTTVNAFNFWGLLGFWQKDNIFLQLGGYLFVFLMTIILFFRSRKNKLSAFYLSTFVFMASFMFFTRIHERHLLPVFAPLAIIAIGNPIYLLAYFGLSSIYIANMAYSYQWISNDFIQIFPDPLIKVFMILALGILIFMYYGMFNNIKISWKKLSLILNGMLSNKKESQNLRTPAALPKINISQRWVRIILCLILIFAFTTRIYNLGKPSNMYFDEVYHAFTARTMMGIDAPKAWEWWNTPPEGFAYEWTHPPLAKLGMVLGMKIFGQNAFGWRVPGAILGTGIVLLIYLLAKEIFKDEVTGLLSAGIFSLDGLPLVLSRIGMNDSYLLFFVLLSVYLFMKGKDLPSSISYGLALASKWSALWAAPILFVLWLKRKRKFKPSIFWFLILPLAIYLLSYLPMFTTGHDFSIWWGMQKQMWWYHTGLRATHPYTSSWWSWPFMIRPVYLYTSDEIGGMVARIYAIGNPLVFWFGLASITMSAIYAFIERNKKLGLVIFSYLIFFVPWAASPRIMFLYHYLPSIPFMSIAIAYVLRRTPKLIFWVVPAFFLSFIYFYPHWAGISVPIWLDKSYYWVSSWR